MPHPLLSAFTALPDVRHVTEQVGRARLVDVSASDGTRPFLVSALALRADAVHGGPGAAPVVVVTATTREAEDLASSLGSFLPADRVAVFPSWETLPHERLSPRSDTVGRRLAVLRRLAHPDPDDATYGPLSVVVAPVRAVLQPITRGLGELEPVALRSGDQRSLEVAEHGLWAPPCRELLLTDAVRERARALADQLPGVADMLAKLAEGIAVEGMESLAPALVEGMESVLDVLPQASTVLLADPERIRRRAHDLVATSEEFLEASWANAAAGND